MAVVSTANLLSCSTADFGNSALTKSSSSRTATKEGPAKPDPENATVSEPQSVAGMYLVSCGPSDVPVSDVPSGKAAVGCGVYDKTTQAKVSQQFSFDVVSFHDDKGNAETVKSTAFTPAPKESRFQYLTSISKDLAASLKAVDGTITVENKKYAGDFAVSERTKGDESPKPPQICSGPIVGGVAGLSVVFPTTLDAFNRPASYLIDGDVNNIWNVGGYSNMVVKLSWTDPSQICAINIFPDYGYKDANNQPVTTGNLDIKVEIGSAFEGAGATLKDSHVVLFNTALPVERLKMIPINYANWPKAGAMQITLNHCDPSWCAIGEIQVMK